MNYDSKITKVMLVTAAAAVGAVCGLLLSAAARAETFEDVKYAKVREGKAGVWHFHETMTIRNNRQEGVLCVGQATFTDKLTMKFANVVTFPDIGSEGNVGFVFSITKEGWKVSKGRQLPLQIKFTIGGKDTEYATFPGEAGEVNDINTIWMNQEGRDAAASLFARADAVTIAVKGKHVGRYNLKDTSKLLRVLAACESGGETF